MQILPHQATNMRKHLSSLVLSLLLCATGLCQLSPLQQKAITLKRTIELQHYAPRPVDDSFSLAVFKKIIETTDPKTLLFTAADFQQLLTYNTRLDDELRGNGWGFADKFSLIYKKALLRADSLINKALQKPFDYTVDESVMLSNEKADFNFAAGPATLLQRWSKYLKYQVLDEMYDKLREDSTRKTSLKIALTSLEPAAREKIKKLELKSIHRVLNYAGGFQSLISEIYLNAIATCFDPHTNYFSPQGKEQFKQGLSTEGYSFGIAFDENEKGQLIIKKLQPGGPAWKSGEMNNEDEVISLQWEGKETADMTGATLEELFEIVDRSNHDKLLFRVRKKDGTLERSLCARRK